MVFSWEGRERKGGQGGSDVKGGGRELTFEKRRSDLSTWGVGVEHPNEWGGENPYLDWVEHKLVLGYSRKKQRKGDGNEGDIRATGKQTTGEKTLKKL